MAPIVVLIVLACGALAYAAWKQWQARFVPGSNTGDGPVPRKEAGTSAVRLLRSDEDVSQALERAHASTTRIAAEIASRRYARLAVAPLRDGALPGPGA